MAPRDVSFWRCCHSRLSPEARERKSQSRKCSRISPSGVSTCPWASGDKLLSLLEGLGAQPQGARARLADASQLVCEPLPDAPLVVSRDLL